MKFSRNSHFWIKNWGNGRRHTLKWFAIQSTNTSKHKYEEFGYLECYVVGHEHPFMGSFYAGNPSESTDSTACHWSPTGHLGHWCQWRLLLDFSVWWLVNDEQMVFADSLWSSKCLTEDNFLANFLPPKHIPTFLLSTILCYDCCVCVVDIFPSANRTEYIHTHACKRNTKSGLGIRNIWTVDHIWNTSWDKYRPKKYR